MARGWALLLHNLLVGLEGHRILREGLEENRRNLEQIEVHHRNLEQGLERVGVNHMLQEQLEKNQQN